MNIYLPKIALRPTAVRNKDRNRDRKQAET